jgi:7-keto-8-aminopelargonate synthetase-like enzyme
VQPARPYIFTTASLPAVAHAVSASIAIIASDEGDAHRKHLASLIEMAEGIAHGGREGGVRQSPLESMHLNFNAVRR